MALDLTTSEVSYNYDKLFLQLAQDFFNIQDMSTAKAGLFGYTTNIASHIAKDATFHRNILWKEMFLNQASTKYSIYNWAKILNTPLDLAAPAHTYVALKIDLNRLLTSARASNFTLMPDGGYEFKLSKDQIFVAGELNFMLPHEVTVYFIKNTNGTFSAKASYDFSIGSTNYADGTLTGNHLKILIEGNFATFFFDLYQITKTTSIYDVLSNDTLDRIIYDTAFNNNLVAFNVSHQTSAAKLKNKNTWEVIPLFFNETDANVDSHHAYYTLVNDFTFRVYFSTKYNQFIPEFNSRVKVELMTTQGVLGNIQYNGSFTILNSFLNDAGYTLINITDIAGGTDQNDFIKSKQVLMNKLRTRDSYITETDLDAFFLMMRRANIATNFDVQNIRIRDDFFRRIFTSFVLMRLKNGAVIPTNTVNIECSFDEIQQRNFSIKPGSIIIYDRDTQKYRLLGITEIPDPFLYNGDSYVFVTPYLLNIDFNEFPKITPYLTNYNRDVTMVYTPSGSVNTVLVDQININTYNIKRNSLIDLNKFILSCNIFSTKALSTLQPVVRLMNGNTIVGIVKMSLISDSTQFYADIKTSDSFTALGEYIIENTFAPIGNTGIVLPTLPVTNAFRIDIAVYDKTITDNTTDLTAILPLVEYSANENISFAEDLSKVIYCPMEINPTTGIVLLERIPLINGNFFFNVNYNNEIMSSLEKLFTVLLNMSVSLENNTSLDLKFYNTMGISKNLSIDTTDIKIHLQIKLSSTYSKDLDGNIRNTIVAFVEKSNYTTDRRFSISNLITHLEKTYPDIVYIQVYSLNNANIQNIMESSTLNKNIVTYVPEFLTVRKLPQADSFGNDFSYDITIDYL